MYHGKATRSQEIERPYHDLFCAAPDNRQEENYLLNTSPSVHTPVLELYNCKSGGSGGNTFKDSTIANVMLEKRIQVPRSLDRLLYCQALQALRKTLGLPFERAI